MIRSALGKVAWVGRTASMVFGLALVLALVVGVASTALSATGGKFLLGKANNASTPSKLTASIAKPALTLVNQSTEAAATALNITVAAGKPPLKVNAAAGTATGLSADELDGKDSAAFQRRVGEGCAEGSSIRTIDANGRPTCEPDDDRGVDEALALRTELGTDDGRANGTTDPVSFSKVRNVPQDVVDRNADTLDGKDSSDFAAADHQHPPVVRRYETTINARMHGFGTNGGLGVFKMCQQDEFATSWGGGFLDPEPKFAKVVPISGTANWDHSYANGEIFRSYPMKWTGSPEAGYFPVQAGDGATPQGWSLVVFNEAEVDRAFEVWVVCQS